MRIAFNTFNYDKNGGLRPFGGQWDIGAYEYGATSLRGDLNRDGQINILDVQLCTNVILGTETNPDIVAKADVNEDGTVNDADVNSIKNDLLKGE